MTEQVSESGHYYYPDGTPAYTIIGKNGKERPTTLADARKLGLLPSVTSIISLISKPGLDRWKQEQAILSALTLPRIEGETDAEFVTRIVSDAKEQARKAAEKGTIIHAWVQAGFEGKPLTDEAKPFFDAAKKALEPFSSEWIAEQSFATRFYGGKVDLHCHFLLSPGIIVDIKTKDADVEGLKTWDEHDLQLAAYREGLKMYDARCFILYMNYKAETKLLQISEDRLQRGMTMFSALVDFFYAKTGLRKN